MRQWCSWKVASSLPQQDRDWLSERVHMWVCMHARVWECVCIALVSLRLIERHVWVCVCVCVCVCFLPGVLLSNRQHILFKYLFLARRILWPLCRLCASEPLHGFICFYLLMCVCICVCVCVCVPVHQCVGRLTFLSVDSLIAAW